jgi:hypothetical protein
MVFAALVALGAAGAARAAGADAVTLSPLTDTNPVGTSHTVTATATSAGQPAAGVTIRFTVTGASAPSDPTGTCTTNSAGQCSFNYTGTSPGVDTISGCADNNNNNGVDPGEPCGAATKIWTPLTPPPCPGDEDVDGDGLDDSSEGFFHTVVGSPDSDLDGVADGNEDSDQDGDADEDEDDHQDPCQNDSDHDGQADEDEDD